MYINELFSLSPVTMFSQSHSSHDSVLGRTTVSADSKALSHTAGMKEDFLYPEKK